MNTSAIAAFLKENVRPFRAIAIERLQPLVERSPAKSFEANDVIMHQGDEATHFGVALSGTIHASVLGDGAMRQSLGRLKAGDTFNELALMTGVGSRAGTLGCRSGQPLGRTWREGLAYWTSRE
jgi:CRP-like cAMP-binding protein